MGRLSAPYFVNMNATIKTIIQDAMFDGDLLAETITYNGVSMQAIAELGATEKVYSPAINHSRSGVDVYSDGYFTVSTTLVPSPARGDKIVYNSKNYYVAGVALRDSVGGNVTVEVRADERVYKNK